MIERKMIIMKNETNNTFYACPYCKEEYANPVDLAHCILSCEEKKKKEEEQKKAEKLAAEKDARYQEIVAVEKHYYELLKAYIKDYGAITIKSDSSEWEPIFGSKPWHWWF
jgi:hypothetical protein